LSYFTDINEYINKINKFICILCYVVLPTPDLYKKLLKLHMIDVSYYYSIAYK